MSMLMKDRPRNGNGNGDGAHHAPAHELRFAVAEHWLSDRNVQFEYRWVAVSDIRTNPAAQVRGATIEQNIPAIEASFKNGLPVPAPVLDDKLIKVDGNTRIAAAEDARVESLYCIVARFPDNLTRRSFQAAMNQLNGQKLNEHEVLAEASARKKAGEPLEDIARDLAPGKAVSTFCDHILAHEARVRIKRVVPSVNVERAPYSVDSVVRELHKRQRDDELKELIRGIERVQSLSIGANEVKQLVKRAASAADLDGVTSEVDGWVRTVRATYASPDPTKKGKTRKQQGPAQKANRGCALLANIDPKALALVATDDTLRSLTELFRWVDAIRAELGDDVR